MEVDLSKFSVAELNALKEQIDTEKVHRLIRPVKAKSLWGYPISTERIDQNAILVYYMDKEKKWQKYLQRFNHVTAYSKITQTKGIYPFTFTSRCSVLIDGYSHNGSFGLTSKNIPLEPTMSSELGKQFKETKPYLLLGDLHRFTAGFYQQVYTIKTCIENHLTNQKTSNPGYETNNISASHFGIPTLKDIHFEYLCAPHGSDKVILSKEQIIKIRKKKIKEYFINMLADLKRSCLQQYKNDNLVLTVPFIKTFILSFYLNDMEFPDYENPIDYFDTTKLEHLPKELMDVLN